MPLVQTDIKSPVAGDTGRWKKLSLDAIRNQLWAETKAGMLWAVPSYADIWLAMMVDRDGEQAWFTDQVETAATDDKFLYINMEWFFKLTLDERLFVACHEIAHAMYGHAGLFYMLQLAGEIRYSDGLVLPANGEMLNVAADYVINDQLVQAKIGKMPSGGLHWPGMINGDMGVLDAYRILYKINKSRKRRPGNQPGDQESDQPGGGKVDDACKRTTKDGIPQGEGSGKAFDKVLKPGGGSGKKPNKAMSERSQAEWDTAVNAAMESAKLQGRLPANLERLFVKRLQPKADWRDLYRLAVSRKVGNDRYTWDRLEPQLIYRGIGAPGRSSYGCNIIVIVVDTSGSIDENTFAVFMAETTSLLEQAKPKAIVFVQCDTDIQEWVEMDGVSDLYQCKLKMGGGTSFKEPFQRIKDEGLEPDLLVYLTDLYGDQEEIAPPSYPVIWGCINERKATWGETVQVPAQTGEGSI
jgi:predicted metal-dependent peptidase